MVDLVILAGIAPKFGISYQFACEELWFIENSADWGMVLFGARPGRLCMGVECTGYRVCPLIGMDAGNVKEHCWLRFYFPAASIY